MKGKSGDGLTEQSKDTETKFGLTVRGKVSGPTSWVTGVNGEVEGAFEHTRKRRWDRFGEVATQRAGTDVETANAQLLANEPLRDVTNKAMSRALEESDQFYADLLARLIGAALDDASIDEVAFLVTVAAQLEPLHIRVLLAHYRGIRSDDNEEVGQPVKNGRVDFDGLVNLSPISRKIGGLARVFPDVSGGVLEVAHNKLATEGMLEVNQVQGNYPTDTFKPTAAATEVLRLAFPELQVGPWPIRSDEGQAAG